MCGCSARVHSRGCRTNSFVVVAGDNRGTSYVRQVSELPLEVGCAVNGDPLPDLRSATLALAKDMSSASVATK